MGTLLLVRHGQAAFGTDDYDRLTPLGERQSLNLGYAWEAGGWSPDVAVVGSMKRHHQTAIASLDVLGDVDGYDQDAGWDELDFEPLVDAYAPGTPRDDPKGFQKAFVAATAAWTRAELTGVAETLTDVSARLLTAFGAVASSVGRGRTGVVFSSGGPIAVVAAHLLGGGPDLWSRLNAAMVNSSTTKIVLGSAGRTLISFNEHGHLPASDVTYR